MSVYTSFTAKDFATFLTRYSLGELVQFEGIQAGIENTNYFVSTTQGEFVFTLFELIRRQELDFYVSLLDKLSASGVACPQPQYDLEHKIINETHGKPFIFVKRLNGESPEQVNARQCEAIATELARFHTTPHGFKSPVVNRRGISWLKNTAQHLSTRIPEADARLIQNELAKYPSLDDISLPRGIIHADLFRDNTLFVDDQLSGIIDFYDACEDTLLLDVAITVNAWCVKPSGSLNPQLYSAFMAAYQAVRPFTSKEISLWNLMLRRAAMRFWLSRLDAIHHPRPGDLTHAKDPGLFKNILLFHIQQKNQTEFKIKQLP